MLTFYLALFIAWDLSIRLAHSRWVGIGFRWLLKYLFCFFIVLLLFCLIFYQSFHFFLIKILSFNESHFVFSKKFNRSNTHLEPVERSLDYVLPLIYFFLVSFRILLQIFTLSLYTFITRDLSIRFAHSRWVFDF